MQVFHSNEDLAGSHTYNIKIIDKYAAVEVNGESDSPKFQLLDDGNNKTYYCVDCGDHDPSIPSTYFPPAAPALSATFTEPAISAGIESSASMVVELFWESSALTRI